MHTQKGQHTLTPLNTLHQHDHHQIQNTTKTRQLHEDDALAGAWRKRCEEPRTRVALSLAQHGHWAAAQSVLGDLTAAAAGGAPLVRRRFVFWPRARVCCLRLRAVERAHLHLAFCVDVWCARSGPNPENKLRNTKQ